VQVGGNGDPDIRLESLSTRAVREIPLVIHIEDPNAPRLALLNKTCRVGVACETLIADGAAQEARGSFAALGA
jgi:hypothetical protein